MRILVFSDSHGYVRGMAQAIERHEDAGAIIYLGDGERDIDALSYMTGEKTLICVSGNCDFSSVYNESEIVTLGGVKIFCTHGHLHAVRNGTEPLKQAARSLNARIALYGHTHEAVTDYDNGLYIMNPGSIREGRYGVIDITKAGIVCNLIKL